MRDRENAALLLPILSLSRRPDSALAPVARLLHDAVTVQSSEREKKRNRIVEEKQVVLEERTDCWNWKLLWIFFLVVQ